MAPALSPGSWAGSGPRSPKELPSQHRQTVPSVACPWGPPGGADGLWGDNVWESSQNQEHTECVRVSPSWVGLPRGSLMFLWNKGSKG